MAGPVQPLLPNLQTPEELEQGTRLGVAVIVAALLARVAPQTTAPVLRYGFGVVISPTTGALTGFTPLFPTNLLPFPFGFSSPQAFGLKPNYYIPAGTSGKSLPSFLPGVKEQRAAFAEAQAGPGPQPITNGIEERAAPFLANFGSESLSHFLQRALSGSFTLPGLASETTAELIARELNRREEERIASNKRLGYDQNGRPLSPSGAEPMNPIQPVGPNLLDKAAFLAQVLPASLGVGPPGLDLIGNAAARAAKLALTVQEEIQSGGSNALLAATEPAAFFLTTAGLAFGLPPGTAGALGSAGRAAFLEALAPGGPAPAVALPGAPPGSVSPSGQAPAGGNLPPFAGSPFGPLAPSTSNTPGATQGQPNWPRTSPDPSGPFPDVFIQHRAGDP